jgi:nucleotide-binding universal stress UspA family protein
MNELAGTSVFPLARVIARHQQAAGDYLDAVSSVLPDVSSDVSTASAVGDPAEVIIHAIREWAVSMVIMASHGHGFFGRIVIGSVADRVARTAEVPVLVVHPSQGSKHIRVDSRARIDRVVVPLDGSVLARQALPIARTLGQRLGTPIHLVRALPAREEVAGHPNPVESDSYDDMIAAAVAALETQANQLRASGLKVTIASPTGSPAAIILNELGTHDLVVMTSHGRSGVRRWLLGSVAERLIHAGEAPVMLVPVAERAAISWPPEIQPIGHQ